MARWSGGQPALWPPDHLRGGGPCSTFPLTPNPSPPEYRGRGEEEGRRGAVKKLAAHPLLPAPPPGIL